MGAGAVVSSLKVNRVISGATTVNANCYAIVSYNVSATPTPSTAGMVFSPQPSISVYFGPGASIPASYSLIGMSTSAGTQNSTYTLVSGVEFINSP